MSTFFMPPFAPCALGEIGLDYYHLPKDHIKAGESILLQKAAFQQQLMLASELDCPVIIHCREAYKDCMKLIDESDISWSRIVFHCFTYGAKEIEYINERGGRASFTGIATYKSAKDVRDALRKQGIERLMLETDCPYLTPKPHRGKQNEPAYLRHIAECCAQNLDVPLEELTERTTANTVNFFNLN